MNSQMLDLFKNADEADSIHDIIVKVCPCVAWMLCL